MANKLLTPEEMKAYVDATWKKCQTEAWQEPVRREAVNNIRVRIMQEAYDLADRDDSEGYNSVKVMCSEVLGMINKLLEERQWQGLDDVEIVGATCECVDDGTFNMDCAMEFARVIETRLKEKNT